MLKSSVKPSTKVSLPKRPNTSGYNPIVQKKMFATTNASRSNIKCK